MPYIRVTSMLLYGNRISWSNESAICCVCCMHCTVSPARGCTYLPRSQTSVLLADIVLRRSYERCLVPSICSSVCGKDKFRRCELALCLNSISVCPFPKLHGTREWPEAGKGSCKDQDKRKRPEKIHNFPSPTVPVKSEGCPKLPPTFTVPPPTRIWSS